MLRFSFIFLIVSFLSVPEQYALSAPFQKWVLSSRDIFLKSSIKVATAATAFACICGSPTYSLAADGKSLESQLKLLQDIKVSNQKRRIEAAELELQSKELLYPEGRLIGRGIIKLMPEDGKFLLFHFTT
jgi:hypothetical protein